MEDRSLRLARRLVVAMMPFDKSGDLRMKRRYRYAGRQTISPDDLRAGMASKEIFGMPVFHGTVSDKRDVIGKEGFKVTVGLPSTGDVTHGYGYQEYGQTQFPPPIHHLGFGVYFTTSMTIAKMFNQGTAKGLQPYYVRAPRLGVINFGSPNTMMKWWRQNGYDMPSMSELGKLPQGEKERLWIECTQHLTDTLSSQYDAVWYKGKGLRKLLDGDQICVYDANNILTVDNSLAPQLDMGNGVYLRIGDRFKIRGLPFAASVRTMKAVGNETLEYRIWKKVIGPNFNYLMEVSMDKVAKKALYDQHYDALAASALEEQDDPFFENWIKNLGTKEASAKNFADRMLTIWIETRFPSGLVERQLKPRERAK